MKASEFTKYLLEQVANHSIYVWGGQGENLDRLNFATMREMETTDQYLSAIYELYAAHVRNGDDMSKAKCFDCSGLGVYFLQQHDIIKSDMTADQLYRLGKPIGIDDVREGDFVFKNKTDSGKWGHVGYVILYNGQLRVVEARGRSYGVVISNCVGWKVASRPNFWEVDVFRFNRVLRKGMRGEDVRALQTLLASNKGSTLLSDGDFGPKTEEAVRSFQKQKKITVDGIAGKNTITLLGGEWG